MKLETADFLIRAELARDIYTIALDNTDAFEDEFGGNLAYLMGALLDGSKFQAFISGHADFIYFLVQYCGSKHRVWDYIELMSERVSYEHLLEREELPLPEALKVSVLTRGFAVPTREEQEGWIEFNAWCQVAKGTHAILGDPHGDDNDSD